MIVLHERRIDAGGAPRVLAKCLHEEPALVAVDGGRQQDEAVEAGGQALHRGGEDRGGGASKPRGAMPKTAAMPPSASGHQTLSAYISSRFDDFSRSQKDVAQYVVDHLDEVVFHTAEELARRAATSSSTVVRFSQALGFEGFPELQAAAREEYRARGPQGQPEAEPLFSLDQGPFESVIAADFVNVEENAR